MTMIFVQGDFGAPVCGAVQACAANILANAPLDNPAVVGGDPGAAEPSPIGSIDGGQQRSVLMWECAPSATDWAAGTAVVRVNIDTANMQMTLEAVYLCQRDSACASKAEYGSATGLALGIGSAGVQSVDVTVGAITALASDLLYVVVEFAAAAGMNQTFGVLSDQNIDTPINPLLAPGEFLRRYQHMPVPNPLVRM